MEHGQHIKSWVIIPIPINHVLIIDYDASVLSNLIDGNIILSIH